MNRSRCQARYAIALTCWGLLASCSSSPSTTPPDTTAANVAVSGISAPLLAGVTGQLSAVVTTANGDTLTTGVTWLSSNAAVATVDAQGVVHALTPGTTTISATAGSKSGSIVVTIANPVPVVASISPVNVTAGVAGTTVTIVGSGFTATSVVEWNGAALATTFTSATALTAQVPASDLGTAGGFPVSVFNPAPGGGTSAPQTLTVVAALPVLTYSQLPDSLVANIDSALIQQLGGVVTSIASPGLISPGATGGLVRTAGHVAHSVPGLLSAGLMGRYSPAQFRDGDCPILSPDDPALNAAGLPQTPLTYTYEDANCSDASIGQDGVLVLTDPTPTSAALNYNIVVTDFHFRLTDDSGNSEMAIINAVDSVRNNTPGQVDEWVTEILDVTSTGNPSGHVVETLSLHTTYTYTASDGALVYNMPMFPGSVVVTQSIVYVIDPGGTLGVTGTLPLQTTTLVPLQFDPTCSSDTPYASGELQTVEAGHTTTTTYHGCLTPPTVQ